MKRYLVEFDEAAEADIEGIHEYLWMNAGPSMAVKLVDQLLRVVDSLEENPSRGAWVPESLSVGSKRYRQVHSRPFRIVYTVRGERIIVLLVSDGRRDIGTLLGERLLVMPPE